MFTYVLMGVPFIGFVLLLDLVLLKTSVVKTRQCWIVMGIMLLLTAIFNQFLTGLPIVTYNESKLLGVYLGYMPIEDFLYTVAAVIGLGSVGKYYEQRNS